MEPGFGQPFRKTGLCNPIRYDRMKTAVIGEDADGLVVYNDIVDHCCEQIHRPASSEASKKARIQ